jgi:hypothetical protein
MVIARDQILASGAFVGVLAGRGVDPSNSKNDKMSALFDDTRENQDWLNGLNRWKTRYPCHYIGDVCKSFALAWAHAYMPEPTGNLLLHYLVAEASQVGSVGNLEPDPDGHCQQQKKKRKLVFAECLPCKEQEESH